MLIGIGQKSHTITSRMQIWSAGYQVRSIKPLEQDIALKDGAEFVGEAFVFLVSGTFVIWEYNRSATAAREKDEEVQAKAKAERDALQDKLIALDARLKALELVVSHNQRSLLGLGGRPYVAPDAKLLVEIDDDPTHKSHREEETTTTTTQVDETNQASISNRPWWKVW